MPGVPAPNGLTDFSRMTEREICQRGQRRRLQVGLISQYDGPMRQGGIPTGPASGALDRAEHAPAWSWVYDAVRHGQPQPVQLGGNGRIRGGTDDGDLLCRQT